MRKRLPLFLVLGILLAACGPGTTGPSKPTAPLQLTIEASALPAPGALVDVTITLTALTDLSDVALRVEVPEEISVFSGDQTWSGPMRRGEQRKQGLVLRRPAEGTRAAIRAEAIARSGPQVLGTQAIYWFGAPAAPPTAPLRGGVREYEAE